MASDLRRGEKFARPAPSTATCVDRAVRRHTRGAETNRHTPRVPDFRPPDRLVPPPSLARPPPPATPAPATSGVGSPAPSRPLATRRSPTAAAAPAHSAAPVATAAPFSRADLAARIPGWVDALPHLNNGDGLLVLAALCTGVALVQTGRIVWLRGASSRRSRKRVARARQGEIEGEALVRAQGYRILAVQPEYRWQLAVDGRPAFVILRPDLVVERDGRRFIADVKTGQSAPDPLSSATRRQLLEYLLACKVDGVLVVDMEARKIHSLTFPLRGGRGHAPTAASPWVALAFGALLGAISTLIAVRYL